MALVKALRNNVSLSSRLEVRIALTQPPVPNQGHSLHEDSGGYEIRLRRTSEELRTLSMRPNSDWIGRTVYIEHLPAGVKTTLDIATFLMRLQASRSDLSEDSRPLLDAVTFSPPPIIALHELDPTPSRPTKYSGFAFVVLRDEPAAGDLLRLWPWKTSEHKKRRTSSEGSGEAGSTIMEATRAGFRALSIEGWLALKDEYLSYQQTLASKASASRSSEASHTASSSKKSPLTDHKASSASHITPTSSRPLAAPALTVETANYPPGCVVFVKNIHPSTNKTTLKQLLSRAFEPETSDSSNASGQEIDYVDYQKNMDTCHVRLARTGLADRVAAHFVSNPTIQTSGLDDRGSNSNTPIEGRKQIAVEVLTGTREELYWSKLPEKVRTEALKRAGYGAPNSEDLEGLGSGRKKRRKG